MSRGIGKIIFNRLQVWLMTLCCCLLAVLLMAELAIVLLRYCFGVGFLELQDVASYAFAALVLLALAPALYADRHVRVDVFRERQSTRSRHRFDRAGVWVLLIPVFAATLFLSLPEVIYSWKILESSKETGGLGGLYLIKSLLPLMCVLMLVQGLGILLRGGLTAAESSAQDRS